MQQKYSNGNRKVVANGKNVNFFQPLSKNKIFNCLRSKKLIHTLHSQLPSFAGCKPVQRSFKVDNYVHNWVNLFQRLISIFIQQNVI